MRQAYFDKSFLMFEPNIVSGVCLGYDRCAEHEWGIKNLLQTLGVTDTSFPLGIEDRLITRPEKIQAYDLRFVATRTDPITKKKTSVTIKGYQITTDSNVDLSGIDLAQYLKHQSKTRRPYGMDNCSKELMVTGPELSSDCSMSNHYMFSEWGSSDFRITVWGTRRIEVLKALYAAMQDKQVSLSFMRTSNPFSGTGLCLVNTTLLTSEHKAKILTADQERKDLYDAMLATGIEAKLKAAGKAWHALQPAFAQDGSLKFFLNPREQHQHNSGWFTLSDLQEWANNTGSVMKQQANSLV